MHTSHFWRSAGLIGIILGAAILSAMIGSRAHAEHTPWVIPSSAVQPR
jgi:type IV secretory pathway TrbF-like protein